MSEGTKYLCPVCDEWFGDLDGPISGSHRCPKCRKKRDKKYERERDCEM